MEPRRRVRRRSRPHRSQHRHRLRRPASGPPQRRQLAHDERLSIRRADLYVDLLDYVYRNVAHVDHYNASQGKVAPSEDEARRLQARLAEGLPEVAAAAEDVIRKSLALYVMATMERPYQSWTLAFGSELGGALHLHDGRRGRHEVLTSPSRRASVSRGRGRPPRARCRCPCTAPTRARAHGRSRPPRAGAACRAGGSCRSCSAPTAPRVPTAHICPACPRRHVAGQPRATRL
jgi:hypothetical protein